MYVFSSPDSAEPLIRKGVHRQRYDDVEFHQQKLAGHLVQGHVDKTGKVAKIEDMDGSFYVTISYDEEINYTTVPQGSITVNGISLTVADSQPNQFSVAIIPYTWEFTNMKHINVGDVVNLEFDIIGKYISKLMQKQNVIK